MSVQETGLTLEGLAQKLEALECENTERLEALERENERMRSESKQMRSENAELRHKVATLEDSGMRQSEVTSLGGSERRLDGELVSVLEGRVSRRSLLSKAGAAAVAAVAAGMLLGTRQAKADHYSDDVFQADRIFAHIYYATNTSINSPGRWAGHTIFQADSENGTNPTVNVDNRGSATAVHAYSSEGTGVEGISASSTEVGVEGTAHGNLGYGVRGTGWFGVWGESNQAGFYGVTGRNTNTDGTGVRGVTNHTDGRTGVRGEGATGVWGNSSKTGYSGVYGQHTGSMGYGVVGDGKGNGAGVLGRNNSGVGYEAFGVKGETADAIGVKGIGRNGVVGESPAGGHGAVYGRHTGSLGYGVVGDGRGNASGVLGRNDTGTGVTGSGAYGGWFEGTKAQLKLKPAASAGVPGGAHTKGEIYMDSTGTLFVCVKGGNPAEWKKLSATAV